MITFAFWELLRDTHFSIDPSSKWIGDIYWSLFQIKLEIFHYFWHLANYCVIFSLVFFSLEWSPSNVWCIKFCCKHSTVLLLCLLRNLMHQTLFDYFWLVANCYVILPLVFFKINDLQIIYYFWPFENFYVIFPLVHIELSLGPTECQKS